MKRILGSMHREPLFEAPRTIGSNPEDLRFSLHAPLKTFVLAYLTHFFYF